MNISSKSNAQSKKNDLESKRESILDEATRMFINDGYEIMKISDLAKRTGVSIGSIYGLFESKEGLYNQYVMKQVNFYIDKIHECLQTHSNPIDMLKAVTEIHFNAMIKNKNALRENIINDPTFFLNGFGQESILMRYYHYISDTVMMPFGKSIGSTKKPLELFFIYDGIVIGAIKYWVICEDDLTSKIDEVVNRFLAVVVPPTR